jgi:hypothetical protein
MGLLDDEIQIARDICARLRAGVEEARGVFLQREQEAAVAAARLEGLERAAELIRLNSEQAHAISRAALTPRPVKNATGLAPKPKGRQIGAISKVWRAILAEMTVYYPEGASDEQIAEIGVADALPKLRPRDARRQMQKYRDLGFVNYAHPLLRSGWKVTPDAASRFGIELPEPKVATDSQSAAASEISSPERT